ncbi:PP2C family protein-serine/threonine phosphatase [Dactylosporangium fulvum]|uniref:Serine/threonine-protein phosphatase n=1 Tax=Dactylosporangium fulvum TaxID=53359 RepID=A0ABY5W0W7_9ACTN|nr:PP2C family protein-serine/threonine phosphatase [Dactylosporangium fulvum]UWP83612.1 serine/threonine-protein phosphatase [Dactylosporangium fulvum]
MSGVGSIEKALRTAPPDRLVETLDAYLSANHGAKSSTFWLADYRTTTLTPSRIEQDPALEEQLAPATRAFASQTPVIESREGHAFARLHLPVSNWGERVGVLSVGLDAERAPTELPRLRELAETFAVAISAAYRRTDRYHLDRRRSGRLTMAAEMQWDLLPARGFEQPGVKLAGQLEPAYAVGGDHFDWAVNGDWLTVTALNGMGTGLDAALLTTLAVNAMRNARRSIPAGQSSPGDLADQAVLAADAIYSQYGGTRHVATLLLSLNTATGELRMIDAGSPRMLLVRGGQVRDVALDPQLPLGMFGDTRYVEEREQLRRGDRLFIVSDGVHAAGRPNEPTYGERDLSRAIRSTRLQPPAEAISSVMRSLREFHAGAELADDALIICLDWSPRADP